tara:strand:- start:13 stop:726 length:714 start_codon:yes stop_codon:yes gene_type:complete
MASRDIRRIINTKQDSLESTGNLSINSMADGQVSIGKSTNELLSIRKKKYGRIYKSYMSSNGNDVVDKNLTVGGNLNVKGHITGSQFILICHNFTDNIGTSEVFIPWFGVQEAGNLRGVSSSFLVPYSMTLKKLLIRLDAITNGDVDISFRLKKIDDGASTVDTVSTARWNHDSTIHSDMGEIAAKTLINVKRSHFDNNPKFEIGDNAGISMQADSSIHSGDILYKITSVWETKIII